MSKIVLSSEYKEAFSKLSLSKDFNKVIEWLKIQKNNIAVLEWVRIKSTDKDIATKKARYEGNIEILDLIFEAIELSKKNEEDTE